MANTVLPSTSTSGMVSEPLWLQATGGDAAINYSATNDRALLDALFLAQGVLGTSALKVSQRGAGANFSVDIAAGFGVVLGDDVAQQGKYLIQTTATVNCVTPGAPGSGTRVHRIIARIRDKQALGSGTYDWTLELLEDTGSGTPAEPASAITLATVSIANGQASVTNANITDLRPIAQTYNSGSLIADTTLSSAASTVTFTSIPQTFRNLMIVANCKTTEVVAQSDVLLRFNNDSTGTYANINITADNSGSLAILSGNAQTSMPVLRTAGGNLNANVYGGGYAYVLGYSSTVIANKNVHSWSGEGDFGNVGQFRIRQCSWCPTTFTPAAVTRIDLIAGGSSNFTANSSFALYGYGS
jgi:hypothetical protein